ncbi:MAG TPA: hypothetical protein VFJ58_29710, partial [Armatimonadota bacterium]|nr:hypothetical protein [Armatimonadota bacterium]
MRIPRTWLLEFLDADLSTEELRPLLTMGIAEVESVECVEDDDVLQVELKPDRGDCLSIEGIAREVAALAAVPFRERFPRVQRIDDIPPGLLSAGASGGESRPSIGVRSGLTPGGDQALGAAITSFEIMAPDLCSRYIG